MPQSIKGLSKRDYPLDSSLWLYKLKKNERNIQSNTVTNFGVGIRGYLFL